MTQYRFGGRVTAILAVAALLTMGLYATPVHSEEEEPATEEAQLPWVRNYVEAQQLAKKEGKDLLINFTGSDWCTWCMRLDEEVFVHADFVNKATEKFIFVFMDKPNDPELQKAVVDEKLRDQLMEDLGVAGFPTIMLTTAEGTPYARTGYQKGGPEAYLKHLDELQADGSKIKKMLESGSSADKTALKDGFDALAKHTLLGYPGYASLLDVAEKADADGSLGLKELVAAERKRQLSTKEEKAVKALLPEERGAQPDWDAIIPALKQTKHMNGLLFLNLVFASTNHLLEQNKGEEAKALLELGKRDPLLEEHARAKEIWVDMMAKAEAAISGDGDDAPDGEDGDK